MTSRTKKKVVAAALATVIGIITLAVQMDIVPEAKVKLATFVMASLSLVNTLFLPAVFGRSVKPPATTILAFFALGLSACACWNPSSEQYSSPGCLLARGIVDCAKEVVTAQFDSAMSQVGAITAGAYPDDVRQKLLSDLEATGGSAALCAIAAAAQAVSGLKMASVAGPPATKTYLRAKYTGRVFTGLPNGTALTVR